MGLILQDWKKIVAFTVAAAALAQALARLIRLAPLVASLASANVGALVCFRALGQRIATLSFLPSDVTTRANLIAYFFVMLILFIVIQRIMGLLIRRRRKEA